MIEQDITAKEPKQNRNNIHDREFKAIVMKSLTGFKKKSGEPQ